MRLLLVERLGRLTITNQRGRRLAGLGLTLVLILVLALLAGTTLATAAVEWLGELVPLAEPPLAARVAFVRQGDAWLLDTATGQEARLTTDGHARSVWWTADGQSLLIGSGSPDAPRTLRWRSGRGAESVTAGLWSTDGNIVAYSRELPSGIPGGAVWVARDGREVRITPEERGVGWEALAWSPDGRRLALRRIVLPQRPQPGQLVPETVGSLWITEGDALGGRLRQLPLPPTFNGQAGWPDVAVWSPDGRSLLVGVGPDQSCNSCRADGLPYYSVPVDGGNPAPLGAALAPAEALSWSPDGSFVVLSGPLGRETYADKHLARVDLPGGVRHDLAADPRWADVEPAVSPDGSTIAFARGRAQQPATGPGGPGPGNTPVELIGTRRVWVMGTDGARPRQLADAPGWADEAPTWTPDGRWIVFVRWHAKPSPAAELWAVRPDGSGLRRLVPDLDVPAGFLDGFGYYGTMGWQALFAVEPR